MKLKDQSGYLPFVFIEKPLFEICLIRIKEQVSKNRNALFTHGNTHSLFQNTSINHKLNHFDDIDFRELLGKIKVFCYQVRFAPFNNNAFVSTLAILCL